jgi:hypothetical protein
MKISSGASQSQVGDKLFKIVLVSTVVGNPFILTVLAGLKNPNPELPNHKCSTQ